MRLVAVLAAVLGGAFVGLFSCGAYAWQKPLVILVVAVIALAALIVRSRAGPFTLWRSRAFVALVLLSYFLSEAIAASFYPAAPASWSQFWQSFVSTLAHGANHLTNR
jgi:hypothetical protein